MLWQGLGYGLDPHYATITTHCTCDVPTAWVKGGKVIISSPIGTHFIFDMKEKRTVRRPVTFKISCCCLSACGKILAVNLEQLGDKVKLYCFETGRYLGRACHERALYSNRVTGIFFPTSTTDAIGVVRKGHVYILPIEYGEY